MKRKIINLLLAMSVSSVLCATVVAAEDAKLNGFYDIGSDANVEMTVYAGDTQVSDADVNVDADETLEKFYADSDRIGVTYTKAIKDEHYGVILVDGNGLPTKDTAIYYINQETATGSDVEFNVYPKLPEESADMTLYISSSEEEFKLVNIALGYAAGVTSEEPAPSYVPGDVNDDGTVDVRDVISLRRHIAGGYNITVNENATDVNRDGGVDVRDVITLRRFIAGGYGIELK